MKNEDKPINPIPEHFDKYQNENIGLTKREYFAGLAMQGLLNNTAFTVKFIASQSVKIADELLKQLETSNTKNQDDRN